jgi:hypothetical protein
MIIFSIKSEYFRYKTLGEGAIEQVPDDGINKIFGEDNNSIAVIVYHISGNLNSRFTDFLTTDGEKSWRKRDTEFFDRNFTREELIEKWNNGWNILLDTLAKLSDSDLNKVVTIRNKELNVIEALHRSLAHTSYHVGQIVFIAKTIVGKDWKSLSVPRGGSVEYNKNPIKEKGV